MTTLKVGLIGVGRLGRMYGQYLARRVPGVALSAVADRKAGLAESFAGEFGVPKWYPDHQDLLGDREIDAVVIVTSTSTHKQVAIDAAKCGKAIFCEKPISLTLADAREMIAAVEAKGVFFQMAFQRRFDAGYLAAKRRLDAGDIGDPVLFTSISRDPYPPPLEFCDPRVSGGLIADMGVHDFDAARMYMGDVKRVHAIGGTLAYPEMKSVGDIDNAIIDLVFQNGTLGVVQLSRNAIYGYDIRGEIWGTKGGIQIGYYRQTPILMFTSAGVTHDAVPYFMERFENAYLAQIQDFAEHVRKGLEPSITGADAVAALRISLAANRSMGEARPVDVDELDA
ncbi:MAG TPA: Gfo/Idh/MocA family oxidoreductase [Candidatus Acidoferrales bacterium]|nr:Gfo/Idh/MocA family oxidoreductase [Candidatus Acidoferrales bacterium]